MKSGAKQKSRIPKFGDGEAAMPTVPKESQLFKCPTCGRFKRMPDRVGYACVECVATPGKATGNQSEE